MRRIAQLVSSARKVLDIGWADKPNIFLSNDSVTGFDKQDAERPENYHRVLCGDAGEMLGILQDECFDAVIAGEILEHLKNPLCFLSDCVKLLSPNGLLIVSTPNPNSPIERFLTLFLSRDYFYAADHVTLYPQRWLIRVMEICGCEDVKLCSGGFPIPGIGLVPFPRPWCYQTIAAGRKAENRNSLLG